MELIHFRGLNCYHDSVVSVANAMGIKFSDAFANLWTETDFRYDGYREAYLTRRLIANLKAMGMMVECFDCFSPADVEKHIAGDFLIVGMDAFHIPWNQFYQSFHGSHYFIVHKERCFDPTYKQRDLYLDYNQLVNHVFDICRISVSAKKFCTPEPQEQAADVPEHHAQLRQALLLQIESADAKKIILLAKYVDALICNRHLYRFFLENRSTPCAASRLFLDCHGFSQWNAVKNGLYKASVIGHKAKTLADVRDSLNRVLDLEISVAEKIMLLS